MPTVLQLPLPEVNPVTATTRHYGRANRMCNRHLPRPSITVSSLLVATAMTATSCMRQPMSSVPSADPPEATLAQQAESVRAGRSDEIRLDRTLVVNEDLKELHDLSGNLRRINFSRTEVSDAGLVEICRCEHLVQLRLSCPRITNDGLALIAELKEMRFLNLINAPITDAGLAHLRGLKQLESLYLDGSNASDEGIERLIQELPDVHLHMDGGHHRSDPLRAESHTLGNA